MAASTAIRRTPIADSSRVTDRLKRIDRLSTWLDNSIRIPGTNLKFGWDSIIGLVPGIGDAATAVLAGYVILEAHRMGVPRRTIARMIGNVAIDTLLGTVPIVGDLFDATFKANRRNVQLIQERLNRPI